MLLKILEKLGRKKIVLDRGPSHPEYKNAKPWMERYYVLFKRRPKWLGKLKAMDKIWKEKEYRDDVDKWTQYSMDLSDLIDAWEKELDDEEREREEKERTAGMEPISEQKIRKLIRKTIRQ